MITADDYDQYENINEFLEEINQNLEIEFSFDGNNYFIWPDYEGKIFIMKNEDDKNKSIYSSADDLVENYKIDGKSLKELVCELKIGYR